MVRICGGDDIPSGGIIFTTGMVVTCIGLMSIIPAAVIQTPTVKNVVAGLFTSGLLCILIGLFLLDRHFTRLRCIEIDVVDPGNPQCAV